MKDSRCASPLSRDPSIRFIVSAASSGTSTISCDAFCARDVHITLITPPAAADRPADASADAVFRHPNFTMRPVPYMTFPFANRRGTTILDRSTAYPLFGLRAGRLAARLVRAGDIDIVHGLGASALGYAMEDLDPGMRAPLVFNPQGLEEFGATDPSRAPLKRLGYWPLRVAVRRTARAADRVIATDRSLVTPVISHLGVSKDVVRVIPNAIEPADCDRPDAAARAQALAQRAWAAARRCAAASASAAWKTNKGFACACSRVGDAGAAERRCPRGGDGCSSATGRCATVWRARSLRPG